MEPGADIFGVGQVRDDGEVGTADIGVGAPTLTIDYHRERTLPDYQLPEYKVIRLLNWNCLPKGDE
jgi:hypothetical protein